MIDSDEEVILVDENDAETGTAPKLDVHRTGQLHRAFSVFVFDDHDRLILQRRASTKYHSPNLWSNACCGHPRPGETTLAAATRRLGEEIGLACDLHHASTFTYRAQLDDNLIEHEIDHVFIGRTQNKPDPDPAEVSDTRWMSIQDVSEWLEREPSAFTAWFREAFLKISGSTTSGREGDAATTESIINVAYEMISGRAGVLRDWTRWRALHAPQARLIPIEANDAGSRIARVMTPEEFITSRSAFFEDHHFYEWETQRQVQQFGRLVHVWSSYEAAEEPGGPPIRKGVNSFQLWDDGSRWWILSVSWDAVEALNVQA